MDFAPSGRALELQERLLAFMGERVYPAEQVWRAQVMEARAHGRPHVHAPVIEELKTEARRRGLWNLFLPDAEEGAGLSNCDYAPLAEIMGRTTIAAEACNCSAPDTGNMEVLHQFGTPAQKERWLRPLLDGEIRSAFAMTEPDVASSDATNVEPADRARGRRVRAQRAQVVDDQRLSPQPAHPDRDGKDGPRRGGLPAAVDGAGAGRRARPRDQAQPAGVRLRRHRGPRGARVHRRARAGREHHRRRGHGLRNRAGPARTWPDPSLHARDRRCRARARAALPPRRRARDLRQAGLAQRQHSRLDRRVARSSSRWRGCWC